MQNFQLLGERGLGCVWKSGGLNYNPLFIEGIGLTRGQRIVGILHIGYFDKAPEGKARTPITEDGDYRRLIDETFSFCGCVFYYAINPHESLFSSYTFLRKV